MNDDVLTGTLMRWVDNHVIPIDPVPLEREFVASLNRDAVWDDCTIQIRRLFSWPNCIDKFGDLTSVFCIASQVRRTKVFDGVVVVRRANLS